MLIAGFVVINQSGGGVPDRQTLPATTIAHTARRCVHRDYILANDNARIQTEFPKASS